jgi:hypothetical protein
MGLTQHAGCIQPEDVLTQSKHADNWTVATHARVRLLPATTRSSTKVVIRSTPVH